VQISKAHPLLSPSLCSLTDIQTIKTPTTSILTHVLSRTLPEFLNERLNPHSKPIKLVVIDALAELFHSSSNTTTATLVERARNISEISYLLHTLASDYQIAVLVLNEVTDAFDRQPGADIGDSGDLIYRDQSRWFSRADSISGENRKEASLGLVWANQVNVRILFSRTGRRRHLDSQSVKHRKIEGLDATSSHTIPRIQGVSAENPILIRRLSIIFSSVALPKSLDYIVTLAGISTLPEDGSSLSSFDHTATTQVPPLILGFTEDRKELTREGIEETSGDAVADEWEAYWKDEDIPEEAYNILVDPLKSTIDLSD
jgi:DNA repair protein RAD57